MTFFLPVSTCVALLDISVVGDLYVAVSIKCVMVWCSDGTDNQEVASFYSAFAMQSAVLATGIPSVHLSVCLSFRHVPALCPDE